MLTNFLEWLGRPENFGWDVVHHHTSKASPPKYEPIPAGIHPRVTELVRSAGIGSLYAHQAEAIRYSLQKRNVVLSTSTASGKSLAYQVPVLDRLFKDPSVRALFLFPVKALERDQRDAFNALAGDSGITVAVYDGDTPESERRKIRSRPPSILITNPDMLHLSILAYHDLWRELFANLFYVVLDEVHTYKGIFGSHVNQVILRMLRICNHYGRNPQFTACSATIANPEEFVAKLIGKPMEVVARSGAPSAERHFVFLKPVLSPYTVAAKLFVKAVRGGLKTIVFTRARKITELITTWVLHEAPFLRDRISSYRAGFLPEERREIESKLFSGRMDGVISTSALEMGIDVGGLDLCLLVGYPGTIVNTWQRGGRVGRGSRPSAVVMIACNDALDQYFLNNPKDFFERNCEEAVLDPRNVEVLKRHIPCAAAELPIQPDEPWTTETEVRSVLDKLLEAGTIYLSKEGAINALSRRPHLDVDLRGIGLSYSIFLEGPNTPVGKSSGIRALTECHEGAVYLHRAKQYVVTTLDLVRRNIFVKPSKLPYYTRALSEKDTQIMGAPIRTKTFPGFTVSEARLKVTERIIAYEKRKTSGQELLGVVDLSLPPVHFETVGIWIEIPDNIKNVIKLAQLHFMGGIHALEHAAISMFPLFALCDRDDIGGISTPQHEQVCRAAVFIYDGHPGGVGLAHRAFGVIEELLEKTRLLIQKCPCEDGCPSCIHSPKCGSGNKPLDKQACLMTLDLLLNPKELNTMHTKRNAPSKSTMLLFPDELMSKPVKKMPAMKPLQLQKQKKVVVFDLETQKLADEVGGWKNISKMRLSLGVAHTEEKGFLTFTEENVLELIELLKSADMVVGFNHIRFDYEVLRAYTNENLKALPSLDILVEVQGALGHRLHLDHLAEFTLGKKKSGDGLQAVEWFRNGKIDLLEKYCREDVSITRDLYRFGLEKGFLLYRPRDRDVAKIQVKW